MLHFAPLPYYVGFQVMRQQKRPLQLAPHCLRRLVIFASSTMRRMRNFCSVTWCACRRLHHHQRCSSNISGSFSDKCQVCRQIHLAWAGAGGSGDRVALHLRLKIGRAAWHEIINSNFHLRRGTAQAFIIFSLSYFSLHRHRHRLLQLLRILTKKIFIFAFAFAFVFVPGRREREKTKITLRFRALPLPLQEATLTSAFVIFLFVIVIVIEWLFLYSIVSLYVCLCVCVYN